MSTPRSIAEYLRQLRQALQGADPALIQDALYDAEEHLRAELAEWPDRDEASMLEQVTGSYGAPDEVAEIYRDQEVRVERALRSPAPPRRRSAIARFFGVAADPRTYGALFYMVLAMATGIFYFTWAVTGLSLSAGLSLLIVGVPFVVLFFGSVRALSLLEGRIVEAMLGVRMPRRPRYPTPRDASLLKRIGALFSDWRTWSTLLYMLLMLPLGIAYGTVTLVLLGLSLGFILSPLALAFGNFGVGDWFVGGKLLVDWGTGSHPPGWGDAVVLFVVGTLLLFATLHLVRAVGGLHGQLAKHLLVRGQVPD